MACNNKYLNFKMRIFYIDVNVLMTVYLLQVRSIAMETDRTSNSVYQHKNSADILTFPTNQNFKVQ